MKLSRVAAMSPHDGKVTHLPGSGPERVTFEPQDIVK